MRKSIILPLLIVAIGQGVFGQSKPSNFKAITTADLKGADSIRTSISSLLLSNSSLFGTYTAPTHSYGIMVNAPDPKNDWTKTVNYQFFVLRAFKSNREIMKVGLPDTSGTTKIIIDIRKIQFVNDTTIIINNK